MFFKAHIQIPFQTLVIYIRKKNGSSSFDIWNVLKSESILKKK